MGVSIFEFNNGGNSSWKNRVGCRRSGLYSPPSPFPVVMHALSVPPRFDHRTSKIQPIQRTSQPPHRRTGPSREGATHITQRFGGLDPGVPPPEKKLQEP